MRRPLEVISACVCTIPTPCAVSDDVVEIAKRLFPNAPDKLCLCCFGAITARDAMAVRP